MPLPPLRSLALLVALAPALAPPRVSAQSPTDAPPTAAPAPAAAASSSLLRQPRVPSGAKSYWIPAAEIVTFDLLLSNFNRATSGSDDYDVSWDTIKRNLKGPWVVDEDPFEVNQFAHPYQGSLYHGAGRSMGLGYWESSALTFLGSAWWEITGEATPPARNDQIASGIAGSFLGEPLFRMAHLVGDHSNLPPEWRPWFAAAISPPVGLNRWFFGPQRYGAVFDDHDPAYYGRWHLGAMRATQIEVAQTDDVARDTAQLDYRLDYGLPGKPGYSYNRPFDYFDFEIALSSKNGMEILATNGLLLGDHFGGRPQASAPSPASTAATSTSRLQVYHLSDTSASLGANAQWWLGRDLAPAGGAAGRGRLRRGEAARCATSTAASTTTKAPHRASRPRCASSRATGHRSTSPAATFSLGRIAQTSAGR